MFLFLLPYCMDQIEPDPLVRLELNDFRSQSLLQPGWRFSFSVFQSPSAYIRLLQWELCLRMDLNLQIVKLAKKPGLYLAPNTVCKSVKGAEGGHACPICFAPRIWWHIIPLDFIWRLSSSRWVRTVPFNSSRVYFILFCLVFFFFISISLLNELLVTEYLRLCLLPQLRISSLKYLCNWKKYLQKNDLDLGELLLPLHRMVQCQDFCLQM